MNIKFLPRRGCAVHRNSSHRSAGTPHRSQHTTEVMDTHLYSFTPSMVPHKKNTYNINSMTLYQALVFKTKHFACLGLSWRTPLHLDQLFVLLCTCEVFLGTNRLKAVSIILDSPIQLSKAHSLRLPTPSMSAMLFSWLTASVHQIHKAISAARKTSTSELLALRFDSTRWYSGAKMHPTATLQNLQLFLPEFSRSLRSRQTLQLWQHNSTQ